MLLTIDENREICKGDDAGLWFENKFYKAQPEKNGRIVIPYEKSFASGRAILVNNGFAQLTEFKRLTESYSLNVGYFVLNESLIMGNEAKILVRPVLKINDRPCTLRALKDIVIKVTTTSYIDNIPITKLFEDPKVNDNNEILLTFQVPPNLEYVTITFDAKVRNISHQRLDHLSHSYNLSMRTHKESCNYYDDYLRKLNGEYYYYLLGKNGEPIEGASIYVNLSHALQTAAIISGTAITDEEGKVNLGALENITRIDISLNQTNMLLYRSEWTLPQKSESVVYPSSLNILEDEVIEIPFPGGKFNSNTFALTRYNSQGNIIEELFDKASLEKDEEFGCYNVAIRDLEFGHYSIELKEIGVLIDLCVHNGVYWESDSFILKQHSIVEKRDCANFIRISKPKLIKEGQEETKTKGGEELKSSVAAEEESKRKSRLKFKIKGYKSSPRVHVYGVTFLPNSVLGHFKEHERLTKQDVSLDVFEFAKWKNAYLSNRELGDEFRYVFERRFLERYIGNTLDRPQLVLKRTKVRDTQFDQESITSGGNYNNTVTETYATQTTQNNPFMGGDSFGNTAPMYKQQVAAGAYTNCGPELRTGLFGIGSQPLYVAPTQYKSFLNFLQNPAFIAENLHPDADGNIEIEFEAEKYSSVLILAVDEQTCSHSFVDLHATQEHISRRDLSLTDPLDVDKFYNEVRNAENSKKDEKLIIDDITSTDYIIIDSLEKVKTVQVEIRKSKYLNITSNDLNFLLRWDSLSEDEKLKKYNRYICHETNLFIYFKDREFFDKVIKPFITNKLQKTFVDLYLLGNEEEVIEYAQIEKFLLLNAFEKCLCIEVVNKTQPETAQKLAERVLIESETFELNKSQQTLIFDTVLNLNKLQGGNINLDDLQSESDSEAHPPQNSKSIFSC